MLNSRSITPHPHPLDKMAAISQTIYSDAFPWMKSFQFWLKFHWSLFIYTKGPGDYSWEQRNVCSDNDLVPNRRQTIIWSSADPIQRRIYAALWGDELTLIVVHTRDNRYLGSCDWRSAGGLVWISRSICPTEDSGNMAISIRRHFEIDFVNKVIST